MKKQHNVMQSDDPDWTPGSSHSQPPQKKRKVTASAQSGELALTSRQEKERRRLQHVLQQVSEQKLVARLLEQLSSGIANATLIESLGQVYDKNTYPPPPKKLATCTRCGDPYDPQYNILSESKNRCQLEHQITQGCKSGNTTWWECDRCGQEWVREWDNTMEGEDVGWCYEGPHHDSDTSDSD